MTQRFWPRRRYRSVGGLDVCGDAVYFVVLTGSALAADNVRCAERLHLPDGSVVHGQLAQPHVLGLWLKDWLSERELHLYDLCVAVPDAVVMRGSLRLPFDLQAEDVAFQIAAELQAEPDQPAVCWDYAEEGHALSADPAAFDPKTTADLDHRTYAWATVPRTHVEAWQQFALAAGLRLSAVILRDDALARTQHRCSMTHFSPAMSGLAPHDDAALGLALGAWHETGFNFLPHRDLKLQTQRWRWLQRMSVSSLSGVLMAVGGSVWVSQTAANLREKTGDLAAAELRLKQANSAEKEVQTALAETQALGQWLRGQSMVQQQTLQWSRVLAQHSQGLWVAEVKQQQAHWLLKGEALSAAQAQHLVQQLKALDIWAQAPELRQLELSQPKSATSLSVWHFRIEADLKVVV
jgi:hypothetical protein